ncbi:hypothetical protein LTR62_001752 [Meristemomyces frigidus]|uniref:Carboxymuconolactone decarboxylase-like domain-containing protein n=1 Tax=Meristemomyces frigidus TaxID=1508187 RepID=A0AAN7YLJ9_9PEZI|nr:hypothetical protein LTR62_001752 [Meristemomyces frigidus]
MSRIPPLPRSALAGTEQQAHDEIADFTSQAFGDQFSYKNEDGAFTGPFPFLTPHNTVHEYKLLISKIASLPGLSPAARETAILATGSVYKAGYELYAHSRVAEQSTELKKEQIEAICAGRKPDGLSEECEVALDVAKYLAGTPGPLPKELWGKSVKLLGKDGTIKLVHYVGIYAYTCMMLNAMDAPVPEAEK